MKHDDYMNYLQSDTWKAKVKQRAVIDSYKCCMCESTGTMRNPLETHHITYRNVGHEDVYRDILTVCKNCHISLHITMNRITSPDGRKGWKDEMSLSNHVLECEV